MEKTICIGFSEKEIILLVNALEYYIEEAEISEDEQQIYNEINIIVNKLINTE